MIQVLIQAAAGSCDRAVYDEAALTYQGMRRTAQPHPYPYGFIVGTRTADGDGLDCYLITRTPVAAGAIVACEPAGLLEQDEAGELDAKVLAVLPGEPAEVSASVADELRAFITAIFADRPDLPVRVGPLQPREAAWRCIEAARRAGPPA